MLYDSFIKAMMLYDHLVDMVEKGVISFSCPYQEKKFKKYMHLLSDSLVDEFSSNKGKLAKFVVGPRVK